MAEQFTFPQSGDRDDAEHFAAMIGHDNMANFVADGLSFTYNAGVPSVDITTGKVFIQRASDTASSSGDTILKTNYVVQVPADTVSLTDNDVNYVYVVPDLGTDDNPSLSAFTTQQTGDTLLIGTIDTTSDTVTLNNRAPHAEFDSINLGDDDELTFGDNSDYTLDYDSTEDAFTVSDSADNDLLEITDADTISQQDTRINGALDQNGDITLNGSFTYDGGSAGTSMNLNGQMSIREPHYISFGAGDALFNSNPDTARNNIHNTGTGGGAYPYNDDFENWVFAGRGSKGDIVFMNAGSVYYSIRFDEGTNRFHQNVNLLQGLDVSGVTDFDNTVNITGGNELVMDGPNGAEIRTISRLRFDNGDGELRLQTAFTGSDYQARWTDNGNNPIIGYHFSDQSTELYSDLIDDNSNTIYDSANQWIPQARVQQGSGSGLDADTVDGFEGADLAGIVYVQSTEPSSPAAKETWLDTSTGSLKVYADYGGGLAWHPTPPAQTLEEAITFTESGVTVTNNRTDVSGGSVALSNDEYQFDDAENTGQYADLSGTTGGVYDLIFADSGTRMYILDAANDRIQHFTLSTAYDPSTGTLQNTLDVSGEDVAPQSIAIRPNGNDIYFGGGTNNQFYQYNLGTAYDLSTATFDNAINAGNDVADMRFADNGSEVWAIDGGFNEIQISTLASAYDLSSVDGGSTHSFADNDDVRAVVLNPNDLTQMFVMKDDGRIDEYSLSGPENLSNLDNQRVGTAIFTVDSNPENLTYDDTGRNTYISTDFSDPTIDRVRNVPFNGDVLISWDSHIPADIRGWDLATYAISEPGTGTVTIDVEAGNGTVLESDIDINTDLSQISTGTDVNIRANISRSSHSDDPSLDYAARRYNK